MRMAYPPVPPAGTSLAGFFVPEVFVDETKPPGILADAIDPRTGEYVSILRGFEPTDAAVLAALSIERGSGAAVDEVGQRYLDLKLLDSSAKTVINEETKRAIGRLVRDRQVQLRRVDVEIGSDWAEVQIEYRNVAQDRVREAAVVVGA